MFMHPEIFLDYDFRSLCSRQDQPLIWEEVNGDSQLSPLRRFEGAAPMPAFGHLSMKILPCLEPQSPASL